MTAGVSTATANGMLNVIGSIYVQMHTGDPGASGTSNIALVGSRVPATLTTATAGIRSLTTIVSWPSGPWVGAPQTVTHVSVWSAGTGGSFIFSAALGTHIDFTEGLRPRLSALSISIPSVASD